MARKDSGKKGDQRRGKDFKYELATGMGLETNTARQAPAVTKNERGFVPSAKKGK